MTGCATATSNIDMLTETRFVTRRLEEERIVNASVRLDDGTYRTDLIIPNMHCIACVRKIEHGLSEVALVSHARSNLSLTLVSVIWDKKLGSILQVVDKLEALGFDFHLGDPTGTENRDSSESRSLLLALAVAGFAAANIMLLSVSVWAGADYETALLFNLISGLIAVPAVLFSGKPFFRSATRALSKGRLNMDVPISLAVLLALGMSVFEGLNGGIETYFDASITLLFFLLIGRYLDSLMRQKARSAVERLTALSSKHGIRILPDGNVSNIGINKIRPGMQLRVFPGERFPVNCQLTRGTSAIDRSHVTGESEHKTVDVSDLVEAGSLNLSKAVDVEAATGSEDSFLGEMQRMIKEAENGRGEYHRIADRMARIYAPAVHLLALIAFLAWMIATGGDWHFSIYTAIAVLIITCPCALGLAVPVAHVVAANRLMRAGILMRDGTALERLAEVKVVIFDKTGTLTKGEPSITGTYGDAQKYAPVIKALAMQSSHPVAVAVNAHLERSKAVLLVDITETPGLGIEATYDGKTVRLGSQDWVAGIAKSTAAYVLQEHSVSFALEGDRSVCFDIRDQLRLNAHQSVSELKKSGLRTEILSGDQPSKVATVARDVGIGKFASTQSPKQKIERIKTLQASEQNVLMVGDGINDAPALAAGHVSFVPASASDIGRHSADFVFTRSSLLAIPLAYKIAKVTDAIVKQNFGLAIAYNCIAVPMAMAGLITPLIAAVAMSASSIVVVANSFRINLENQERGSRSAEPKLNQMKPTGVFRA